MRKFKILAGLILIIISLLIACDDFLSPTIEIFNEITTPTNVEQEQKKEQQNNTVQQNQSG
jgi:hypothetical protein